MEFNITYKGDNSLEGQTDLATIVSAGATKAGAATAVFGGLTANEIAAIGGIVIALIGLCYNIWHGERRLKILANKVNPEEEA